MNSIVEANIYKYVHPTTANKWVPNLCAFFYTKIMIKINGPPRKTSQNKPVL